MNEGWETGKLTWVDEVITGGEVRESVSGEGWVELELQTGQCGFFFSSQNNGKQTAGLTP